MIFGKTEAKSFADEADCPSGLQGQAKSAFRHRISRGFTLPRHAGRRLLAVVVRVGRLGPSSLELGLLSTPKTGATNAPALRRTNSDRTDYLLLHGQREVLEAVPGFRHMPDAGPREVIGQ